MGIGETTMKLHPIFTDRMVLPANKPLRIFGEGDKAVTVSLSGQTAEAVPCEGKWQAQLSPMPEVKQEFCIVKSTRKHVSCEPPHSVNLTVLVITVKH